MSEDQGKIYIGYDGSGLFKIGITRDEKKRLKQIRTGNATFMYLFVFPAEEPAVMELEFHTKFEYCHVEGEWFDLAPEDLKWIYDKFIPEEHRKHGMESFEIVWDVISNKRRAYEYEWRHSMRKLTGQE